MRPELRAAIKDHAVACREVGQYLRDLRETAKSLEKNPFATRGEIAVVEAELAGTVTRWEAADELFKAIIREHFPELLGGQR